VLTTENDLLSEELIEDDLRFNDVVINGNGIDNSVVIKWIQQEMENIRKLTRNKKC
jgi:hypothetical protein